jgi:alkanesulfonate monooxygenase SsuD/methylene tetrahydromethanopterin reductase-like flavin-dependent oxidoreductase (luciferase family)
MIKARLMEMDFGVGYFPTHDGMDPAALARMLEESGQDAVFFAEHTHIPASRDSPWPGGPMALHCRGSTGTAMTCLWR